MNKKRTLQFVFTIENHTATLRSGILASLRLAPFTALSAILDCKDTNSFGNKKEKWEKNASCAIFGRFLCV
ncbi:MAG: hypothetical protein J6Y33_06395 [Prevotella sp.]|nr:hypothetical protein [Prevotella sp.]